MSTNRDKQQCQRISKDGFKMNKKAVCTLQAVVKRLALRSS